MPRGASSRARRGHRVDRDRRLLALELVDGADAGAGQRARAIARDLGVVRRDDEDVLQRRSAARRPSRRSTSRRADELADQVGDRPSASSDRLVVGCPRASTGTTAQARPGERPDARRARCRSRPARDCSRPS